MSGSVDLGQRVVDLFAFLEGCGDFRKFRSRGVSGVSKPLAKGYRNMMLFGREDDCSFLPDYVDDSDIDGSLLPDVLGSRLDMTMVQQPSEKDVGAGYKYLLVHTHGITPRTKSVRGKLRMFVPQMVEYHARSFREDGTFHDFLSILGFCGGRWLDLRHGAEEKGPMVGFGEDILLNIHLQRFREERWSVEIGLRGNANSVNVLTDGVGVKELIAMRSVPEGARRRSALLHWVSDHYRRDRRDPDVEVYVRKHLRGSRSFDWGEFRCRVIPSLSDTLLSHSLKKSRRR